MPKKLEDCVKQVSKSRSKSSAYAICTASLEKAGVMKKSTKDKDKAKKE